MGAAQKDMMKERATRIRAIEAEAGLREGMYRVSEADRFRWFFVWIEFYPEERWMTKEVDGPVNPSEIEGSRCRLDADLRARLEAWL